jgi:hypothetical protein
MMTLITSIIFLFFLTGLFLTWFFIHKAKVKERMLLIEKGVDLNNLPKTTRFNFIFPWFKLGFLITSISFGCLLGVLLMDKPFFHSVNAGLPVILMFMFGGAGMILAYFLDKPKEQK